MRRKTAQDGRKESLWVAFIEVRPAPCARMRPTQGLHSYELTFPAKFFPLSHTPIPRFVNQTGWSQLNVPTKLTPYLNKKSHLPLHHPE